MAYLNLKNNILLFIIFAFALILRVTGLLGIHLPR